MHSTAPSPRVEEVRPAIEADMQHMEHLLRVARLALGGRDPEAAAPALELLARLAVAAAVLLNSV